MSGTTKRTFSAEFKQEAAALLQSIGRPLTRVATELGVQPSMLLTLTRFLLRFG